MGQVTTPPCAPPPPDADTKMAPGGSLSVRVTPPAGGGAKVAPAGSPSSQVAAIALRASRLSQGGVKGPVPGRVVGGALARTVRPAGAYTVVTGSPVTVCGEP